MLNMSSQIAVTFSYLSVIVIVILALGFYFKKLKPKLYLNTDIDILGQVPLSHKEKLVLVKVNDKKLLLGVTSNNINTLHSFDKDEN